MRVVLCCVVCVELCVLVLCTFFLTVLLVRLFVCSCCSYSSRVVFIYEYDILIFTEYALKQWSRP